MVVTVNRGTLVLAAFILALFVGATLHRNRIWSDDERLWRDTVAKSPLKSRPHAALAYVLMQRRRYHDAMDEFGAVYDLSFLPEVSEHDRDTAQLNAVTNIATLMVKAGEPGAEAYLRNAWLRYPGFPGLAVGISFFDIQHGRFKEALAVLTDGIHVMQDRYPQLENQFGGSLYYNRGVVYEVLGDCADANLNYQQASRFPDVPIRHCED